MKYNTFLFDFDGTIINSIEAIILSMRDAFEHFDLPPPSDETICSYIGIPIETIPYLSVAIDAGVAREEMISKYREIYKSSYGRTHIKVYDGMKELLLALKARGDKLGIVSSKATPPLEMNLRDKDMEGIFDAVIGSDQVTQYKPMPETVFLCAQKVGLEDVKHALVIGDARHDIEMGRRAGMDTCAVPWGGGTQEELAWAKPTYFPKTVEELSKLLLG